MESLKAAEFQTETMTSYQLLCTRVQVRSGRMDMMWTQQSALTEGILERGVP